MKKKTAKKKSAKVAMKGVSKRVSAKKAKPRKAGARSSGSTSVWKRIEEKIADLGDWRGERLAEIRKLIHEIDSEVVEEWKWMGTAVWSHEEQRLESLDAWVLSRFQRRVSCRSNGKPS